MPLGGASDVESLPWHGCADGQTVESAAGFQKQMCCRVVEQSEAGVEFSRQLLFEEQAAGQTAVGQVSDLRIESDGDGLVPYDALFQRRRVEDRHPEVQLLGYGAIERQGEGDGMLAGVEASVLQAIDPLEGGGHTPAEAPPVARLHRHFPERVVSVMRERKQQVMSLARIGPAQYGVCHLLGTKIVTYFQR